MRKKKAAPVRKATEKLQSDYLVDAIEENVYRDPELWTHSKREKSKLKRLRKQFKDALSGGAPKPKKHIPVYDHLIYYVRRPKDADQNFKTTISFWCGQADIPNVLAGKDIIKYQWNGQTYKPGEFPWWYD